MPSNSAQHAEEQPKVKINRLTDFVNNYIPESEQTYNFAIPIIGFGSSCISFGMFMTFVYHFKNPVFVNYTMYNYGYIIISGGCAVELYYGLRNKNRKQYFFWILLKSLEVILILIAVVDAFVRESEEIDFATIGSILIIIKILLLYYMIRRVKSKRIRSVIPPENMYDLPTNVQNYDANAYTNVTVY